jgi:hypothetical protein
VARVGLQRHREKKSIQIFITISKREGTYGKKKLDRSELQEKGTSIGKPK